MAIKKYKPVTPSRRQMSTVNYRAVLTVSEPHKPLTRGFNRAVGRSNAGRLTSPHRGGGHKRLWREVDFKMNKRDMPARVETVEYDPNRSGFIALVCYRDGERRYILTPQTLKVGDEIVTSANAPARPGNRLMLKFAPAGTFVYNVEVQPGGGGRLARSAGNSAQVLAHDAGYTTLKMPSTEVRKVRDTCWASVGAVSNEEYNLVNLGKAGRSRWMGRRPKVRGTAMNPVDHPYGGGEGRQGRGTRRPKTRHGKVTGGRKTRRVKKYSNQFIISRRLKKRRG